MTTHANSDAGQPEPDSESPVEAGASNFLVSLLVMLALLVTAELFYRGSVVDQKMRKGVNYVTAKADAYATLGGDVVWTGDSRMYHAINPAVLTETLQAVKGKSYTAFDFGIPSGTTPIFLMIANEAARHKPPPRVFILGVTPALFSCCDQLGSSGTQFGATWSVTPRFVRAAWYTKPEDAGMSVFIGASHLLAGRSEIAHAVHEVTLPAPIKFHDRGYWSMGNRVSPAVQDVRAKGRAGAYAELMDKSKGAKLLPTPGRYLGEAIDVLQRAGVNVIVMGTPQARQLDWYHDEAHTYFEYLREVKRVAAKHGVPFVDMNAPPGIESTDFMDGDHLSEPGAVVFTKYVGAEIIAPYLP
jgi:hypothetical protein